MPVVVSSVEANQLLDLVSALLDKRGNYVGAVVDNYVRMENRARCARGRLYVSVDSPLIAYTGIPQSATRATQQRHPAWRGIRRDQHGFRAAACSARARFAVSVVMCAQATA